MFFDIKRFCPLRGAGWSPSGGPVSGALFLCFCPQRAAGWSCLRRPTFFACAKKVGKETHQGGAALAVPPWTLPSLAVVDVRRSRCGFECLVRCWLWLSSGRHSVGGSRCPLRNFGPLRLPPSPGCPEGPAGPSGRCGGILKGDTLAEVSPLSGAFWLLFPAVGKK